MAKAILAENNTATSSFSYNASWKKKSGGISVPFLPSGYEKELDKYQAEGMNSEYREFQFERVLKFRQNDLKKYCKRVLKKFGYSPKCQAGFLYAEGEIPIMLIAHLDTVHEVPKNLVYKDNFVTCPTGIGGDDRCGIYSVLEIVKDLKCHVLFTEDEEQGGIGASLFTKSIIADDLKGKIKYCIELDRRGSTDAVFYDCDNTEFIEFIEGTGYFKEAYGSFSDISYVAPALDCSAVNLSIGYYSEHTKSEYIDIDVMRNNIEETKKIIRTNSGRFEWVERKHISFFKGGYYYDDDDYWDEYWYNQSFKSNSKGLKSFCIYWDNFEKSAEYVADTREEAIGYFMIDNPYVCYADVDLCDEIGSWRD